MMSAARRFVLPTLFLSLLLGGCQAAADDAADPGGGGGGDDDDDGMSGQCEGPLGAPRDPGTLPECCQPEGGSHCLPAGTVPEDFRQYTPACDDGGLCVPDPFIATGGVYEPPSCTSLNGAAGVCLSACIPQVAEVAALLPAEGCGLGERCVPCISPLDNLPTGACDIVGECVADDGGGAASDPPPAADGDDPATCVHEGAPVVDPRGLTPCGEGAHCLQATLVPADFVDRLGPCADAAYKCVPDVFLATGGDFIPVTCRSLSDTEGRCLSRVIPEVAAQADLLPAATCGDGELCVPCFSPIDGQSTGSCDLSCDTGPTEPAKTLAACCEGQATCVPSAAVPAALQTNLEQGDCADDEADALLCVPNDLLAYQQGTGPAPGACAATGFLIGDYTGVCLSDCLSFGLQGLALARGDCDADYTCAPCVNPLNGTPTGAPGCPAAP